MSFGFALGSVKSLALVGYLEGAESGCNSWIHRVGVQHHEPAGFELADELRHRRK